MHARLLWLQRRASVRPSRYYYYYYYYYVDFFAKALLRASRPCLVSGSLPEVMLVQRGWNRQWAA